MKNLTRTGKKKVRRFEKIRQYVTPINGYRSLIVAALTTIGSVQWNNHTSESGVHETEIKNQTEILLQLKEIRKENADIALRVQTIELYIHDTHRHR